MPFIRQAQALALVCMLGLSLAQSFLEYRDPARGFVMAYPSTWVVRDINQKRSTVFVNPNTGSLYPLSVTVSVGTAPASMTIQDAERFVIDTFETLLTDFSIARNEPGRLGGKSGKQMLFTARQGKFTLAGFIVYTLHNGRIYSFTFECERKDYERFQKLGGDILGSFRFL